MHVFCKCVFWDFTFLTGIGIYLMLLHTCSYTYTTDREMKINYQSVKNGRKQ